MELNRFTSPHVSARPLNNQQTNNSSMGRHAHAELTGTQQGRNRSFPPRLHLCCLFSLLTIHPPVHPSPPSYTHIVSLPHRPSIPITRTGQERTDAYSTPSTGPPRRLTRYRNSSGSVATNKNSSHRPQLPDPHSSRVQHNNTNTPALSRWRGHPPTTSSLPNPRAVVH